MGATAVACAAPGGSRRALAMGIRANVGRAILASALLFRCGLSAETVVAPEDWRAWPLAPKGKKAPPTNTIDPASVPAVAAFPGAEGHGALSIGGRGGRVIKVTTLKPTGPGSLDEALRAKGPRIVTFDVSGVIRGDFVVADGRIYVAGQTAPGAGITIEGNLYTRPPRVNKKKTMMHDVTLRFLRLRLRPVPPKSTGDLDGLRLYRVDRGIVDHVSVAWAVDEGGASPYSTNVTWQWCSIEESATVGHKKGSRHNYALKGADYPYGFIHHNLMANNYRRCPSGTAHVYNNVAYNFEKGFLHDAAPPPPDLHYASNLVGNYYKRGPNAELILPMRLQVNTAYWCVDNYIHGVGLIRDPWEESHKHPGLAAEVKGKRLARPRPYPYFPVTIQPAERACELVLAHAGCLPRDRVTRRTVADVRNGTGAWGRQGPAEPTDEWFLDGLERAAPPHDADKDGIPDEWERAHGLTWFDPVDASRIVPRGASDDDRHAGYTFIEYYLNELADRLVQRAVKEAGVGLGP